MQQVTNVVVSLLLGVGVLATCIAAWRVLARLSSEPRAPVPWNGWLVMLLFVAYLVLQAVAGVVAIGIRVAASGDAHSVQDFVKGFQREAQGLGNSGDEATPAENHQRAARFATLMLGMLAAGIVTLAGGALLLWAFGARSPDLGLSLEHLQSDVWLGVQGFFAFGPPVFLMQGLLRWAFPRAVKEHEVEKTLAGLASLSGFDLVWIFTAMVLGVCVAAPLVEEFLFRVVLQGWCEAWASTRKSRVAVTQTPAVESVPNIDAVAGENPYQAPATLSMTTPVATTLEVASVDMVSFHWGPVIAASLMFAGAHFTQWPDPIPLFFFSMGLGYLYQRTHRFLPSVITHACLNSFSMTMLWITVMVGGGKPAP